MRCLFTVPACLLALAVSTPAGAHPRHVCRAGLAACRRPGHRYYRVVRVGPRHVCRSTWAACRRPGHRYYRVVRLVRPAPPVHRHVCSVRLAGCRMPGHHYYVVRRIDPQAGTPRPVVVTRTRHVCKAGLATCRRPGHRYYRLRPVHRSTTVVHTSHTHAANRPASGRPAIAGTPAPGWSKGKKTGWHGSSVPPGHSKKDDDDDD